MQRTYWQRSFTGNNRCRPRRNHGFTLVELLVVIAIIAMLITSLMPAIQAARSSARRAQCKGNMVQLVMALQNYEMAHEHFPAGVSDPAAGPIQNVPSGHHHSWLIPLLPYLDESSIHRNMDASASVYNVANAQVRGLAVPSVICPSDVSTGSFPRSSYAGCHHDVEAPIDSGNHGVFFLNSRIAADDVHDGMSHTLFIGEKISYSDDLGWMSGTRATLRNTGAPINAGRGKPQLVAVRLADEPDEDLDSEELSKDTEDGETEGGAEVGKAAADDSTDVATEGEAGSSVTDVAVLIDAPEGKPLLVVGGFGSHHSGGAHVAFGDGRIQFMSSAITVQVLQQLAHRDDGKLLDPSEYRE